VESALWSVNCKTISIQSKLEQPKRVSSRFGLSSKWTQYLFSLDSDIIVQRKQEIMTTHDHVFKNKTFSSYLSPSLLSLYILFCYYSLILSSSFTFFLSLSLCVSLSLSLSLSRLLLVYYILFHFSSLYIFLALLSHFSCYPFLFLSLYFFLSFYLSLFFLTINALTILTLLHFSLPFSRFYFSLSFPSTCVSISLFLSQRWVGSRNTRGTLSKVKE